MVFFFLKSTQSLPFLFLSPPMPPFTFHPNDDPNHHAQTKKKMLPNINQSPTTTDPPKAIKENQR